MDEGQTTAGKPIVILMADDDEDDRLLTQRAMKKARLSNDFRYVEDGVELMAYLRREGRFAADGVAPTPDLLLLDLNMPRMDGREALREIKADAALNRIPVVVLTTSDSQVDIDQVYAAGGNSYIVKPVTFTRLVEMVGRLGQYWFQVVKLP